MSLSLLLKCKQHCALYPCQNHTNIGNIRTAIQKLSFGRTLVGLLRGWVKERRIRLQSSVCLVGSIIPRVTKGISHNGTNSTAFPGKVLVPLKAQLRSIVPRGQAPTGKMPALATRQTLLSSSSLLVGVPPQN